MFEILSASAPASALPCFYLCPQLDVCFLCFSAQKCAAGSSRTSDRLSAHLLEGSRVLRSSNTPNTTTWIFRYFGVCVCLFCHHSSHYSHSSTHRYIGTSIFVRDFLLMVLMVRLPPDNRVPGCLRNILLLLVAILVYSF